MKGEGLYKQIKSSELHKSILKRWTKQQIIDAFNGLYGLYPDYDKMNRLDVYNFHKGLLKSTLKLIGI